jgi:hypothetical protein
MRLGTRIIIGALTVVVLSNAITVGVVAILIHRSGLELERIEDTTARVHDLARENHAAIHAIRHVEVARCLADAPFREQAKTRARIEADVLAFLIELVRHARATGSEPPELATLAIRVFRADLRSLVIYPTPDCHRLRVQLRRSLTVDPDTLGLGPGHHVNLHRAITHGASRVAGRLGALAGTVIGTGASQGAHGAQRAPSGGSTPRRPPAGNAHGNGRGPGHDPGHGRGPPHRPRCLPILSICPPVARGLGLR